MLAGRIFYLLIAMVTLIFRTVMIIVRLIMLRRLTYCGAKMICRRILVYVMRVTSLAVRLFRVRMTVAVMARLIVLVLIIGWIVFGIPLLWRTVSISVIRGISILRSR